jgi:ABC-type spermidine/putrescine transport system permease subunit I
MLTLLVGYPMAYAMARSAEWRATLMMLVTCHSDLYLIRVPCVDRHPQQ